MFMARTLGRTVEELEATMSAAEFGDWAALYAIESGEASGPAQAPEPEQEMDVDEFLRRTGKHG